MPPSRRRPVPTTPTTRPRVAGLRKRPEPGTAPADAETSPVKDAQVEAGTEIDPGTGAGAEPTDDRPAARQDHDALPGDRDVMRATDATGLIEPREDTAAEDETPEPAPRPRPTGRRKRTGEAVAPSVLDDPGPKHAKPGADDVTEGVAEHDPVPARSTRLPTAGPALPIALVVLAGLLVGLGVWFQHREDGIRYNQALVDSAGTTEVAGQAREAVEKAFSYNFADVSATEKAANELLVGKAQCQYNAIFGPVRELAPEQKLVVTVKAVSSGVTSLDGDRATVLLFLDQVTTRTTDNQSGGGIAMMRVGAQRVDGRWKVDNMEMFGQSGDQAAETAKC
ncbi:Mce-associated membrane protein [Saccharothrix carnea]|uniref:Mce-associated membrane protein n=1 Tax=Saccharothrix carnea TaxID=1280637 RepID=A0A2P8I8M7_SACCR|nr:Mce-associated membrane protein [Saccharothrix carnea]